ncbi:hypothetical protein COS33_00420 [Candidatus Wolfebacteria bacterium CG02_land_8_20_14_3_00_37_12]|uniref:DUF5667 domain-containing protein n=1 Tax=Candidatus Wolfebacteria bacterium CG02_land_8_20_14_3_00_37_12 TaxID=1975066 RepID=A0A2M7CQN6_9BACT|nr:MAG: hypothetical protein COS33_00420 [Candidatus Wolfebacteria bacterium CG02_land_8_20_14_3_00_37_12]
MGVNKDLFKILKELKNIQPDDNYTKQSKMLILSSPQLQTTNYKLQTFFEWFNFKHSAMLAASIAIFVFIILWTVSYLPGNKNSLVAEANEINASIQVKLDEIGYHLDSQKIDFSMATNIQNLLKITTDELIQVQEELENNPEKLKESVEKIKKAEQNISEINSLLKEQSVQQAQEQ